MIQTFAATLLAAAVALPAAAASANYRYRTTDYAGAVNTQIYALNDARQYVGSEQDPDGLWHAVFDDGTGLARLDLAALGADVTHSFAFSINGQAEIAGTFRNTTGYHGFLRHPDGTFEVLDYPGGVNTQDYGVNDLGEVIGVYADADGVEHAFKRVGGVMSNMDLPGASTTTPLSVNDAGQIVGQYLAADGVSISGFVQQADGSFKLYADPVAPPGSTFFISINNGGDVLGAYYDAAGVQVNFLVRRGHFQPVDLPASFTSTYTSAQTINDGGDVVGFYDDAAGLSHGVTAFTK